MWHSVFNPCKTIMSTAIVAAPASLPVGTTLLAGLAAYEVYKSYTTPVNK